MNINEQIKEIKDDNDKRSLFIETHQPFIIGKITRTTNRYVRKETDEVFLVGLEAFNEAITRFDESKGNFLPFAGQVIQSRITDWMRKEKKRQDRETRLGDYDPVDTKDLEYEVLLKDEVFNFKNELSQFQITFDDLVTKAPKKEKTRKKVTTIGTKASQKESIVTKLFKTRKLPMKEIQSFVKTTLRILKTHRDFIISVMIIKVKKFDLVANFLIESEEG
ncbi:hypothetical protein EZV73_19260 [Acidaminobacter sp. JC074]|uniref:sigma factor n=1 Tax=Acidaminobacter sp. JC074 TaxID=2530199 RepID=UPI001F0E8238|nr:hypothetical protein [Acidaminobacter sp. JC074]